MTISRIVLHTAIIIMIYYCCTKAIDNRQEMMQSDSEKERRIEQMKVLGTLQYDIHYLGADIYLNIIFVTNLEYRISDLVRNVPEHYRIIVFRILTYLIGAFAYVYGVSYLKLIRPCADLFDNAFRRTVSVK